jgi:hypothetical protein
MKHPATIVNREVKFLDRAKWLADIASHEGEIVTVSIEKKRENRSMNLNSYYWGVVVRLLSDYTGFDKDEMHEALKYKFLYAKKKVGDDWVEYTKSTTKLTNTEMVEFIESVKRWAAEAFNVYIPDPNEL